MTDRRKFLSGLPVAAVALAAGTGASATPQPEAAVTAAPVPAKPIQPWETPVLCRPVDSGNVIDSARNDSFPHVAVTNQHGLTVPFYETFILDRVAVINFMSIADEAQLGATAAIAGVVRELGDKVGRDVHFYSVTRDPKNDTPERLAEFAARFDAPEGWYFLTASAQHCADLAFRMYRMGHATLPGPRSVDVAFYGNGKVGLWGTFPIGIRSDDAAERVLSLIPRQRRADGTMRRAGPRRLPHLGTANHNRELT